MYLPCATEGTAVMLSERLWKLSRPEAVAEGDVTQNYTSWVKHPSVDAWYINLPDGDEIYIHPDADERAMDEVLAPFVIGGLITQQTLDDMADTIDEYKGSRLVFTDHVPPVWLAMQKTKEELDAMGFFPPPNL